MLPSDLLDTVARELVNHAEQKQIHQLALAACQHQWPQDPNLLNQYRLRDLTQDLTRAHNSFEALKQTLRQTLNLAPESQRFIPAGRAILQATRYAYQRDKLQPSLSETRSSGSPSANMPLPYEEIALVLSQSPRATRIRKLIHSVSTGEWSNDPAILAQFPLSQWIEKLHRNAPSLETLRADLYRVVAALNRREAYELVAQEILSTIRPLYSPFPSVAAETNRTVAPAQTHLTASSAALLTEASSTLEEDLIGAAALITHPGIEGSSTIRSASTTPNEAPLHYDEVGNGSMAASSPQGLTLGTPANCDVPITALMENQAEEDITAFAQPVSSPPLDHSVSEHSVIITSEPEVTTSEPGTVKPLDWQALAELRVELMRYANPLRVKALIFSTLYYPFDMDANLDWSKLQTETLGDLLLRLVAQFTSYKSLEAQLQTMASQLRPSDAYGSTAGAIARAIRPFYP